MVSGRGKCSRLKLLPIVQRIPAVMSHLCPYCAQLEGLLLEGAWPQPREPQGEEDSRS